VFDAELYLRLTGERLLLDRSDQHHGFGTPLVHPARALVAAGAIELDRARELLHDYEEALALRHEGMHHALSHVVARAPQVPEPFPARRVVACDQRIEQKSGTLHVRYVSLSEEVTELGVAQRFSSSRRRGHMLMGQSPSATLADDRGTSVGTGFSGHGSDDGWHGRLQADDPLARDTAWIEVDGVRIELADDVPEIEVTVEPLPEQDPAWRHLWCSVAAPDHMHDYSGIELAVDALLAAGAITEDDPRLDDLRAVVGQSGHMARGGRRGRRLPQPWRSVRTYGSLANGRRGHAVLGAVTPLFDGITVAVSTLLASEGGFSLEVETRPDVSGGMFNLSLESPQVAWWVRDDAGNHYLGESGSWSGSGDHGSGTVAFEAGLDPKATRLDLMPTGPTERAVIAVPLDLLRPEADE
jgi:hypothetical protein